MCRISAHVHMIPQCLGERIKLEYIARSSLKREKTYERLEIANHATAARAHLSQHAPPLLTILRSAPPRRSAAIQDTPGRCAACARRHAQTVRLPLRTRRRPRGGELGAVLSARPASPCLSSRCAGRAGPVLGRSRANRQAACYVLQLPRTENADSS